MIYDFDLTCIICGETKSFDCFKLRRKGRFSDRCFDCQKTHPKLSFEERTKAKISGQHSRAKGFGVPSTLTYDEWMNILIISQGFCFHCHKEVGIEFLTLDHVLPVSRFGSNTVDNVVPACSICNMRRNNKTIEEYKVYQESIVESEL